MFLVRQYPQSNHQRKEQSVHCQNVTDSPTQLKAGEPFPSFIYLFIFFFFERPKKAFDAASLIWDSVACCLLFFWVSLTIFLQSKLVFPSLYHYENLATFRLIPNALTGSTKVEGSICVLCDQTEILWHEDAYFIKQKPCRPQAIIRYISCSNSTECISI